MPTDKTGSSDVVDASVTSKKAFTEGVVLKGVYSAVCRGADGEIKWTSTAHNLVTNVGRQAWLAAFFSNTGAGTVFMGLKATGTAAYTDTQANHSGWVEVGGANAPTYSGTRKVPSFGPATTANPSVISTSAVTRFVITSNGTIAGAFINIGGASSQDSTSGVLFSVGDFFTGPRGVSSGDQLDVSYSLSVSG